MMKRLSNWTFVAVVVLLPMVLFTLVKWFEQRYTALPVLGPPNHRVAAFYATDHHGQPAHLAQWKNQLVVAHVFFTHCPAVCPKMIRQLKRVQQAFVNRPEVRIVSFTVDPERDSVAQLAAYARRMNIDKQWQLLTSSKKTLYQLARKSLLLTATDGDGGPEDFIHSETLVLLDRRQQIRGFYKGTDPAAVDDLLRDLEKLRKE